MGTRIDDLASAMVKYGLDYIEERPDGTIRMRKSKHYVEVAMPRPAPVLDENGDDPALYDAS